MVCPPRGEAGCMDRAQYRLLLPAPPQCQFACGLLYLVPRNYPNCACMQLMSVSHCLSDSLALKEVSPTLAQRLGYRTPGPGLSHLEGEK